MAKRITPAIEKIEKKKARQKKERLTSTPFKEALRRFARNKLAIAGCVVFALLILIAILAPVLAPEGYDHQNYSEMNQLPSLRHLCGTDQYGRDILARIIWGTRVSLPIGLICCVTGLIGGGFFGAIAAFFGGKVDMVIMRIMDVFSAVPSTLMAIAIAASLGTGMFNLILAMTISRIPIMARTVRAAVFTVRGNDYVESAVAMGASTFRQIMTHMLPNAMGPIIVQATFSVASSILAVASLSYIGLGISAPTPEWGSMLASGREVFRQYPHIILFPGIAIIITVLSLNLLGDGLRDALDPRLK